MGGTQRMAAILATLACSILSSAAEARCPPKRSDARVIAEGGLVFTGRVVALGPRGASPLPAYADLEPLDDATGRPTGAILRVHAPRNGLYTASFENGAVYRLAAYRRADGYATSGCDLGRAPPLNR